MNSEIEKILKKNKYRSKFYQDYKRRKPKKPSFKPKENNSLIYRRENKENKLNIDENYLWRTIYRALISAIILLVVLISRKDSSFISQTIYTNYNQNINFMKIDRFLTGNLGSLFPVPKKDDLLVNNSYVGMDNTTDFKDGVMVSTEMFEGVQAHTDGIVTNIYYDDELGNVIVIQDINNNEYIYAGIEDVKVRLYNRIQYGETLGIAEADSDYTGGTYYLAIRSQENYLNVVDVISLGNQTDDSDIFADGDVAPIGFGTVDE